MHRTARSGIPVSPNMRSILERDLPLDQGAVFANRRDPDRAGVSRGAERGCQNYARRVKQPAPLRFTGPNEDGTISVSVTLDVRISDWEALRESQRGATEAERAGRGDLADPAVVAFAVVQGVSSGRYPDAMDVANVHVNYLRAAVARRITDSSAPVLED
jgi:hypothetical protein